MDKQPLNMTEDQLLAWEAKVDQEIVRYLDNAPALPEAVDVMILAGP